MKLTTTYFDTPHAPNRVNAFFWWLSGADPRILQHSPYADHVKYFGLGGIVLTTGILAALSGGYAFYTVFATTTLDAQGAVITDWSAVGLATLFALIWGAIILNLDRFIVASSGIGDGTGRMSWATLLHAFPRIFMALVLSIVIAAPLELRIFESEIDAALFRVQHQERLALNALTDSTYAQRMDQVANRRAQLETELADAAALVQAQEIKYQEEIAGRVSGIPGAGSAAKAIRIYLDQRLIPQLDTLTQRNTLAMAQLQLQTDSLQHAKEKAYAVNDAQVQQMGGLLQRLSIAHAVAGWKVTWLIRLIFMVIETAPIFFKMMMRNEVYETLHDHLKAHILKSELES